MVTRSTERSISLHGNSELKHYSLQEKWIEDTYSTETETQNISEGYTHISKNKVYSNNIKDHVDAYIFF